MKEEESEKQDAEINQKGQDVFDSFKDTTADLDKDIIKAAEDAENPKPEVTKKSEETAQEQPRFNPNKLSPAVAHSMRKFMRMFRVYGMISVEDFFGWFCGIVTILVTLVACLVIQYVTPVSRPSLSLAGWAMGVTLGNAMIDCIPSILLLYSRDDHLEPLKIYYQGKFRPPITVGGEMLPLMKILGGILLAFFIESVQGGREVIQGLL